MTFYIVAAAIMTPASGFLPNRFGVKRSTGSIAGFTIASMLCGAAQSLDQIVLFRVLQGMCGAALAAISASLLDSVIQQQATTIAYNDDHKMLMLVMLASLLLLIMFTHAKVTTKIDTIQE